jgi:hypothetical protein
VIGGKLLARRRWLHSGRNWRRLQRLRCAWFFRTALGTACAQGRLIGVGDLRRVACSLQRAVCRRSGLGDVICECVSAAWASRVGGERGACACRQSRSNAAAGAPSSPRERKRRPARGKRRPAQCSALQLPTQARVRATAHRCRHRVRRSTATATTARPLRHWQGSSQGRRWRRSRTTRRLAAVGSPLGGPRFKRFVPPRRPLESLAARQPAGPSSYAPSSSPSPRRRAHCYTELLAAHIRFLGPNCSSLVLTTCRRVGSGLSLYWLLQLGNHPALFDHYKHSRHLAAASARVQSSAPSPGRHSFIASTASQLANPSAHHLDTHFSLSTTLCRAQYTFTSLASAVHTKFTPRYAIRRFNSIVMHCT